jgi:uncharacterized membrane protein YdjX (TVP38/TMEM64 family)
LIASGFSPGTSLAPGCAARHQRIAGMQRIHLPDRTTALRLAQRHLPILVSLAIVVLFAGAYVLIPQVRDAIRTASRLIASGDRQALREWVAGFGHWGPLVLMAAFLLQMVAFAVPSWLLMVVSVVAFGPVWGSVYAILGIALVATVAYGLGRVLGEVALQRMLGERTARRMHAYLTRYGFWVVIIFRLAPFLSNDIISYAAGLIAMAYPSFIGATIVGITPLIALIALLGESNERLRIGFLAVSVISLLGFAWYVWSDHRRRRAPASR